MVSRYQSNIFAMTIRPYPTCVDSEDDLGPFSKEERMNGFKEFVLIPEIEQMMFVAGETGEPSAESTALVEEIVHEQVVEMVRLSRHCLTSS